MSLMSSLERALDEGVVGNPSRLAKFGSAAKEYLGGMTKDLYDQRRWSSQQQEEDSLEKERKRRRMSVLYDNMGGPYY